jgi:hypothetical protein
MDLEVDIGDMLKQIDQHLPSKPVSNPLVVGDYRPLTAEDAAIAEQAPAEVVGPPHLVRLRTRHHVLAQLIATGLPDKKVAVATGYSQGRISVLKADPAFKELLAHYMKAGEAVNFDIRSRLEHLALDSIEVLQDRLDTEPEEFSAKELMDMAEMSMDRTGHGKSSTVRTVHGLDDETISLIKGQHEESRQGRVLNLSEGEFHALVGASSEPIQPNQTLAEPSREQPAERLRKVDQPIGFDLPEFTGAESESARNPLPSRSAAPSQQTQLDPGASAKEREHDREGPKLSEGVGEARTGAEVIRFRPPTVDGREPT